MSEPWQIFTILLVKSANSIVNYSIKIDSNQTVIYTIIWKVRIKWKQLYNYIVCKKIFFGTRDIYKIRNLSRECFEIIFKIIIYIIIIIIYPTSCVIYMYICICNYFYTFFIHMCIIMLYIICWLLFISIHLN